MFMPGETPIPFNTMSVLVCSVIIGFTILDLRFTIFDFNS